MKDEPTMRDMGHGKVQVDFGYNSDGKQIRRMFENEAAALLGIKAHKAEIKKLGEFWVAMRQTEREKLVLTLKEIKEEGTNLPDVWSDWKRWKNDMAQSCTTPMPYEDVVTSHYASQLAQVRQYGGARKGG